MKLDKVEKLKIIEELLKVLRGGDGNFFTCNGLAHFYFDKNCIRYSIINRNQFLKDNFPEYESITKRKIDSVLKEINLFTYYAKKELLESFFIDTISVSVELVNEKFNEIIMQSGFTTFDSLGLEKVKTMRIECLEELKTIIEKK